MSIAQSHPQKMPPPGIASFLSPEGPDDLVGLRLRESARSMIGIALFSGVINILMLSGSLYMLQVYDRVIPSRNIATLVGLSLMVLLAYIAQGYFDALRSRMLCRVATMFDAGLQESIHTALATLPLRGVKPVLMQQPLRDLDQVRAFMSSMGPTAFLDMPWIPIFLIGLFLFHPAIGVTAVIGTAAIISMTLLTERLSKGAAKSAMESSAQRQVLADATQRNAEVIRALGMLDRFTARWSQANERYLRENVRATDVSANLGSSAKVLRFVLQSGMLGMGAYLVVADKASGGIMIASSILMGRALAPVEVALGTWKQLIAARQSIVRLREICRVTARPPEPPVVLPRPSREFSVQDLTVAAPGTSRPLVSNISFTLTAGTGLALLGASASGKTSLSKALVGIWPTQQGVVRLDGAALDQWRNEDLGRYVGYLPQDVALFDGTVAENICRFDNEASSDAILKAAQIAGVHDIILRLPDGYSTRIGEGGMSLSAGQRQRIGLARAVFGDPFLIVLDEPNANLDSEGENALTRAIAILRHNKCIVIVISHRPSALAALNMAMVLYDGKAIAFGPCEEIFARVRAGPAQVAGPAQAAGAPQVTAAPQAATAPQVAMAPKAAMAPQATVAPKVAVAPQAAGAPRVAATPQAAVAPRVAAAPQAAAAPKVAAAPQASAPIVKPVRRAPVAEGVQS
jgi:ATP-binding cassette subfamily C protein PrsD